VRCSPSCRSDIKKVLAYSTVSQLGFMVTALGVGAWTAAMFHLFTHAFFKACLFLGAGSLSHACHHSFDMVDDMGGTAQDHAQDVRTYMIGTAALDGHLPAVTAGFWSKDEILAGTGSFPGTEGANGTYYLVLVMLLLGCVLHRRLHDPHHLVRLLRRVPGPRPPARVRSRASRCRSSCSGHPRRAVAGPRSTCPRAYVSRPAQVGDCSASSTSIEPVGVYFPGHGQGISHAGVQPAAVGHDRGADRRRRHRPDRLGSSTGRGKPSSVLRGARPSRNKLAAAWGKNASWSTSTTSTGSTPT
jgi:NADH-quinone oxidoreductase subunit L